MRKRPSTERTFQGFVACLDQIRDMLSGGCSNLSTIRQGALERIAVWAEHDRIDDEQERRLRDYVSQWGE